MSGKLHFSRSFYFFLLFSRVSEALLFGTWVLSQALAYSPNINSALDSSARILRLIDSDVVASRENNNNEKSVSNWVRLGRNIHSFIQQNHFLQVAEGNVDFANVSFHYPSRPEMKILENFNLSVKKFKNVALVGPSGSGKSTCIQLLLKFYDPTAGVIVSEIF